MQKALPMMTDGASIILQGSIAGSRGRPGRSVYNASKAALRSFARTWAQELKGRNIRVNLLVPGPTATAALAGASPEVKAFLASQGSPRHDRRPERGRQCRVVPGIR